MIYDACVLYPAPMRDLLVQLATADPPLFRAKWTDEIHDEWIRNLLNDRTDLTRSQLERTRQLMNISVQDCLVDGYGHLLETIDLPDLKDRHVAAAAIHARADAIVTLNLKDFPESKLKRYNLEAIHPDDFITYQIDLDEAAVVIAAQICRARLKNPTKTADEYLAALHAQSLPKTVVLLRPFSALI